MAEMNGAREWNGNVCTMLDRSTTSSKMGWVIGVAPKNPDSFSNPVYNRDVDLDGFTQAEINAMAVEMAIILDRVYHKTLPLEEAKAHAKKPITAALLALKPTKESQKKRAEKAEAELAEMKKKYAALMNSLDKK